MQRPPHLLGAILTRASLIPRKQLSKWLVMGGHRFHPKWKAKKGQAMGKDCHSSLTKIASNIILHGQSDKQMPNVNYCVWKRDCMHSLT
jgi:hypothetical protein